MNQYDVLLDAAYKKHLAGRHPDLQVREAQLCLSYLGFKPGKVDGAIGNRTLTALAEFQKRSSFRVRRAVDEDALAELRAALPTLSTT